MRMRVWSSHFLIMCMVITILGFMRAQELALPDDADYDYALDQSDEAFDVPEGMYEEFMQEGGAESIPDDRVETEAVIAEQIAPRQEQKFEPQFESGVISEPESEPAFQADAMETGFGMQEPDTQESTEPAPIESTDEQEEPVPMEQENEVAEQSAASAEPVSLSAQTEQPAQAGGNQGAVPEVGVAEEPTTTKPSAVAPMPIEVTEGEDVVDTGLDTINIDDPAGNWFLKRVWWEHAQQKYDKIKLRFDEVRQLRTAFFAERTDLDQNILDPFYFSIGVEQGELIVVLEALTQEINQLRQKSGTLTQQERELLEAVGAEQKILQQLQEDVMAIREVDNAVDEALRRLMEQTDLCRRYETEAYQYFKDIGIELSDQNAKVLYYKMDANSKNIANIVRYIKTEFTAYFNQLITTARERTERVKGTMTLLKEKGIDFKNRAQILKDMPSHSAQAEEQGDEVNDEQAGQGSWYSSITSIARSVGTALVSVMSSISDLLGSMYTGIIGLFSQGNEKPVESAPEQPTEPEKPVLEPVKTEE